MIVQAYAKFILCPAIKMETNANKAYEHDVVNPLNKILEFLVEFIEDVFALNFLEPSPNQ